MRLGDVAADVGKGLFAGVVGTGVTVPKRGSCTVRLTT
jgi:hypothetical protein